QSLSLQSSILCLCRTAAGTGSNGACFPRLRILGGTLRGVSISPETTLFINFETEDSSGLFVVGLRFACALAVFIFLGQLSHNVLNLWSWRFRVGGKRFPRVKPAPFLSFPQTIKVRPQPSIEQILRGQTTRDCAIGCRILGHGQPNVRLFFT